MVLGVKNYLLSFILGHICLSLNSLEPEAFVAGTNRVTF